MGTEQKRVLCFIDDDPAELSRFERAFADDFRVVAATSYSDAILKLREAGYRSPHLWVLDLYFPVQGRINTPAELHEMSARFEAFDRARREFSTYLQSIGQGKNGGINLLGRCRENHRAPVVMFTRKGTIDDAIACLSAGAVEVLKKPMPHTLPEDEEQRRRSLDAALLETKADLADRFKTQIHRNTHWAKFRGWYLAVATFLLGILIDRSLGWIGL